MENLPVPTTGKLLLLIAPRLFLRQALPVLIARLSLTGPLRVLDGGNSFNLHEVARALRRSTPDVQARLERIQIARAFTCYQVVSLLAETPANGMPTLGLDLTATFYDESVHYAERKRLLRVSIATLQQLSHSGPVAVSVSAAHPDQPDEILSMLTEKATQVWRLSNPEKPMPVRLL